MKNLFLSILLVLTVSFAFATSDVEKQPINDLEKTVLISKNSLDSNVFYKGLNLLENPNGTCTITVTYYNQDGEVVGSDSISFETTYTGCLAYARLVAAAHQ